MRACIYSAICGDYDVLKKQPQQTIATDFICFTDSSTLTPIGSWQMVRSTRRRKLNARMRAKYFKIMSHRVFPDGRLSLRETFPLGMWRPLTSYDYLIWIDGSVQIKRADFVEYVIAHIGNSGWTMFVHPDRDCIYEELLISETLDKYGPYSIRQQVDTYLAEAYPEHNGLMATGIIGRKPRDRRLATINEMWWQENMIWSPQCQLSLPVVLWRQGRSYDPINLNLWQNHQLAVEPHAG
jgi:hypothetical protein